MQRSSGPQDVARARVRHDRLSPSLRLTLLLHLALSPSPSDEALHSVQSRCQPRCRPSVLLRHHCLLPGGVVGEALWLGDVACAAVDARRFRTGSAAVVAVGEPPIWRAAWPLAACPRYVVAGHCSAGSSASAAPRGTKISSVLRISSLGCSGTRRLLAFSSASINEVPAPLCVIWPLAP